MYMARQLCCRGMCKNLLRSDGQQRNYNKAKFSSNLNCRQNIVSETGPWAVKMHRVNLCRIITDKANTSINDDEQVSPKDIYRLKTPALVHAFDMIMLCSVLPNGSKPFLNYCWLIVRDQSEQFRWNQNHHVMIFITKKTSENVVCKTLVICLRPTVSI